MAGDDMGPPGLQESRPAWCNYKSLLDILDPCIVHNARTPPIVPPVSQYIEEVYMSLNHGPGDPNYTGSSSVNPSRGGAISNASTGAQSDGHGRGIPSVDNVAELGSRRGSTGSETRAGGGSSLSGLSPVWRVERLAEVLRGGQGSAARVGSNLFWVALAGVFGRVPTHVVDAFKKDLSEAWYELTLHVYEVIQQERDARDWLLAALPVIYGQIIYRILIDAFEDDRKDLIANCMTVLDKLTLVIHFQVIGFQVTAHTVRKARRKLLLKNVLNNPHVNQLEFLRGMKRQQKLESESSSMGNLPLSFGKLEDGRPLDETQLEHVMQGRNIEKSQPSFARVDEAARPATAVPDVVDDMVRPEELLYKDLPRPGPWRPPSGLGVESYADLSAVGSAMQERQIAALSALVPAGYTGSSDGESSPTDLDSQQQPDPPVWSSYKSVMSEGEDRSSSAEADAAPQELVGRQFSKGWQALRMAHRAKCSLLGAGREKAKRERNAKIRRMKHEALHNAVATNPLPPELSQRQIVTTWVSPMTHQINPGEKDRCMLRKGASETFLVKMTRNPFPMNNFSSRTASLPDIGGVSKPMDSINSSVPSAGGAAGWSSDPASSVGVMSRATEGSVMMSRMPVEAGKPRATQVPTGETMILEPPQNLKKREILQRLETQMATFRKNTFGEYVKEYDVLTGELKQRFDENRLRREESIYLKKMDSLVGGPPKRLIPLKRRGGQPNASAAQPQSAAAVDAR